MNRKAFGASFLYWVDFSLWNSNKLIINPKLFGHFWSFQNQNKMNSRVTAELNSSQLIILTDNCHTSKYVKELTIAYIQEERSDTVFLLSYRRKFWWAVRRVADWYESHSVTSTSQVFTNSVPTNQFYSKKMLLFVF